MVFKKLDFRGKNHSVTRDRSIYATSDRKRMKMDYNLGSVAEGAQIGLLCLISALRPLNRCNRTGQNMAANLT